MLVFLDDDVRADVAVLESYAIAASAAGRGHFFGGPVAPEYEETPPPWLLKFLPTSTRGYDSSRTTWEWFLGYNWAAYGDDLKRVGGFDERLGPGGICGGIGDETELQMRLRAVGLHARYSPRRTGASLDTTRSLFTQVGIAPPVQLWRSDSAVDEYAAGLAPGSHGGLRSRPLPRSRQGHDRTLCGTS